ncbi:hypothetical protein HDV04_004779 [Boothiomyces sp. JEL0838]|nr:hypothetical protein HDV04_004779 [Boothiomyces sp. JEL0838]
MVAGHSRTGKTDFIYTLFETLSVQKVIPEDENQETAEMFPLDVTVPTPSPVRIECSDPYNSTKILLRFIDTPGLDIPNGIHRAPPSSIPGLEYAANQYADSLVGYIEQQFQATLEQESKVRRNPKSPDFQVHACLYLLNPDVILASKGLTIMDKVVLEQLTEKVNVIPCLAKSDLITVRDLQLIKGYIRNDLGNLAIYSFPEEDLEEEVYLQSMIPFCMVNSEELYSEAGSKRAMGIIVDGKKVLGREYLWGTIEVENPKHCDFDALKTALLGTHLEDLRLATREEFYEKWRTESLTKSRSSLLLPADLKTKMEMVTLETVEDGGQGWNGPICCVAGSYCSAQNQYYSQCIAGNNPNPPPTVQPPSPTQNPTQPVDPTCTVTNVVASTIVVTSTVPVGPAPSSTIYPPPPPMSSGIPIGPGTVTPNYLPPFPITINGKKVATSLTIDANWRWIHTKTGYTNCYDNGWSQTLCPDAATCAQNCVLEGVSQSQWPGTYGVTVQGNQAKLGLVTGSNIGSRLYLLDPSSNSYQGFLLKNREFSFTVDTSTLGCGINGALYFVQMQLSNSNPAAAGPAFGTGYGDAQCPTDIKYVNGIPNVGKTPIQVCSPEMDIWEANSVCHAMTPHACKYSGVNVCKDDVDCGNGANRPSGQCDKDGADYNPYRVGDTTYYGVGKTIDTSKPMTVITQFITNDGTDHGDLVQINRIFKQNGVTIKGYNITDASANARKAEFGEPNVFKALGGLKKMGDLLETPMVLVMSVWGDTAFNMEWLDSVYPEGSTKPGSIRGSCPAGTYQQSINANQNSWVQYSDVQVRVPTNNSLALSQPMLNYRMPRQ